MARSFNIEDLKDEYQKLWDTMEFTRSSQINEAARRIIAGRTIYQELENETGVPWWFIGALHYRESNCDFSTHLHNGDPLARRTRQRPAGRPKAAPANGVSYTWLESAKDALAIKGLDQDIDWTIPRILYEGERYNGWGYRYSSSRPRTPYLWAGTNHYTRGKFVSDGRYSASTVDKQLGIAPVMKKVLEISGAKKVPGSRKGFVSRIMQYLGFGSMGFVGVLNWLGDFITDWRTLAIFFGATTITIATLIYLDWRGLIDYREGRYVPSKERKEAEDVNANPIAD